MKLFNKMLLILIFSAGFCCLIGEIVKIGFAKYNYSVNTQFIEIFSKKTTVPRDIVIIGSSRAHLSINPQLIDSICNITSYNAGINGAGIFEYCYVLKAYLVNNPPPKILLLNLDLFSFRLDKTTFYFPVYINYTNNREVEKMIQQRGYNSLLYKCLPFIFLKDLDDNAKGDAIKGFQGVNDIPPGDFQYNGYLSNSEKTLKKDTDPGAANYSLEKSSLPYLAEIIQICNKNKIHLIFNYAPEYNFVIQRSCKNSKAIMDFITNVAETNKSPYLRGDSLSLCKNPNYFANSGHLNKPGAKIYSIALGNQLKKILSSNKSAQVFPIGDLQ